MKSTCKTVLVFILIFSMVSLASSVPVLPDKNYVPSSDPWLSGWNYRKEINITSSTGAGSNYQVRIDVAHDAAFNITIADHWSDNAHQGVATDGTYVYTTNSSGITKFTTTGTLQDSHDTSGDGTYGDYIGDLTHYNGCLYVAAHDSGFTDHYVMQYNATDLSYITEFDVEEPTVTDWDGGLGVAYNDGYFWLISDSHTNLSNFEIQQYNLTFSQLDSWEVPSFGILGYWHYQGLAWFNDTYIFCPIHEGSSPYIDVYKWNGDGFEAYQRIPRPAWTGSGNTNTGTQGIDIQEGVAKGVTHMWLASRNGVDAESEVAKLVLTEYPSTEGHSKEDYTDIRFTDNDGTTLLDYWREDTGNATVATFWIEVADSLETDVSVYLYYGNSDATDLSDGTATFLFYEDWTGETIDGRWSIKATDGTVSYSTTDANHGSVQQLTGNAGANRYYYISNSSYDWDYSIAMRYRANQEECSDAADESSKVGFEGWGHTNTPRSEITSDYTISGLNTVDDNGNVETGAFDYWDSYYTYDIMRNGTYSFAYVNGALVATVPSDPDEQDHNVIVYDRDNADSTYTDWILVRKWIDSEPDIESFGDEEPLTAPSWNDLGTTYYVVISIDPVLLWGMDVSLILIGLLLLPLSTMYLVGNRKNMTRDKAFFFIVLLMLGLGLFVGGITP